MIAWVVVHRSGQEQHAAFVDEFIAESFHLAAEQFGEGNWPGLGANPRKTVAVAGEKVIEQGCITALSVFRACVFQGFRQFENVVEMQLVVVNADS